MSNAIQNRRRARNGDLRAKPVMIYPPDPDIRTEMVLLASLEGLSLSQWLVSCALTQLKHGRTNFSNWSEMLAAFRDNEIKGIRGMVGVPSPVVK